jgi:hypothetical protein
MDLQALASGVILGLCGTFFTATVLAYWSDRGGPDGK